MPQEVKIWEISDTSELKELPKARLDFEDRLEEWLEKNISIISDNLFVIGRQVETSFGGVVDLLCLDRGGDLVILELKRDRTPREVITQLLDYASWVRDLSSEDIEKIATEYFGKTRHQGASLEQEFQDHFKETLPEILNQSHKMLIVASELDGSSERVINYLSGFGIGMNAVSFHYFRRGQQEFLARVFLIEPRQVETRSRSPKRRTPLTEQELQEIADNNGVGELYSRLTESLTGIFDGRATTRSSIAYTAIHDGSKNVVFSLLPPQSDAGGGLKFQVYMKRFSRFMEVDEDTAEAILPETRNQWKPFPPPEYSGYEGYFKNIEEVERFLTGVSRQRPSTSKIQPNLESK